MKHRTKWDQEIPALQKYIKLGLTLRAIAEIYDVTHQRIYQVFDKYGLETPIKTRKNWLKGRGPEKYWLNRILVTKKVPKPVRKKLLETLPTPKYCPMLGLELNYNGTGREGWSRSDTSPSLDQIKAQGGYIEGNIQVISWRANRIKNNSTPEELMLIANYMLKLI